VLTHCVIAACSADAPAHPGHNDISGAAPAAPNDMNDNGMEYCLPFESTKLIGALPRAGLPAIASIHPKTDHRRKICSWQVIVNRKLHISSQSEELRDFQKTL
jgi:hypothetical protein